MDVERILAQKGRQVHVVPPGVTLGDAVNTMHQTKVSALVVSEDGKHIVGIVSDRDVMRLLGERGITALDTLLSEVMTRNVVTCSPGDRVDAIMSTMTERRFRHVPVVNADGLLCGLISIGDVVKHRLDEMHYEAEHMRDYIAGNAR